MEIRKSLVFALLVVAVLCVQPASSVAPHTVVQAQRAAAPERTRVQAVLESAPLMFIENVGQFDGGADFQLRDGRRTIWIAENAIWVTVLGAPAYPPQRGAVPSAADLSAGAADSELRTGVNIKLTFVGANPHPRLEPFHRLDTQISYFLGADPAMWHASVPVWGSVRYVDLYPGVDLELDATAGSWRTRILAHPGANLEEVRISVEGADVVGLEGGALRLATITDMLVLPLPLLVSSPSTMDIPRLAIEGNCITAPFVVASSAVQESSEISPLSPSGLLYSTFVGGSDTDQAFDSTVDAVGSLYVVGQTYSVDFPTTAGVFDPAFNGGTTDAFVTKLNASGSGLVYSTYIGGAQAYDSARAVSVDAQGAAYVFGSTYSADFPTTAGAFDRSFNGGYRDAFVTKLNASGSALGYSTFLGGASEDDAWEIIVDASGEAYVTGSTTSANFPTTPGALDPTPNGGDDAFIVKFNGTGSAQVFSTVLGGSTSDMAWGIAMDAAGALYVAGTTYSGDFPVTPGAYDSTLGGSHDAFVAKINSPGTELVYSTYLGGSSDEWGDAVAVDTTGAAYIVGSTSSADFPTTPGAFQRVCGGCSVYGDAFILKLNNAGSALVYSTYLGGSFEDEPRGGITVDPAGAAYVLGYTDSSNFPTTPSAYDPVYNGGYDAFVSELNASGSALVYSTYLGGHGSESVAAITVDAMGDVYVAGDTNSNDFPVTSGGFDPSYNGYTDVFVSKLTMGGVPTIDLSVDSVVPAQALEVSFLVEDKETAIKAVVRKSGTGSANNISARVDVGGQSLTRFYVAENLGSQSVLVFDNSVQPLNFSSGEITKTVYFFGDVLAPTGSSYQASVTVDYLGAISETDEGNNTTLSPASTVHDTIWSDSQHPNLYLHYFRTDWEGNPIAYFTHYYDAANQFLTALYPVAEARFTPDYSPDYVASTAAYRGLDGRLQADELARFIRDQSQILRNAQPDADRFIGVVPPGWFAAYTVFGDVKGQSYGNTGMVMVEVYSSPWLTNPQIVPHEIGHSYTLPDVHRLPAASGLWVAQREVIAPSAARPIFTYMSGYTTTYEYWTNFGHYEDLYLDHAVAADSASGPAITPSPAILAVGSFDITGTVVLDDWYVLPDAELDLPPSGPCTFEYQNASGGVLFQQNFAITTTLEGGAPLTVMPFAFTIPYVPGAARIIVKEGGTSLAQKTISANSPVVTVIAPNGGEQITGETMVEWSASDADGDTMSYAVLVSPDLGRTWKPIVSGLSATSYVWDASGALSGHMYLIKVIATDGVNTGQDTSDGAFTIPGGLLLPFAVRWAP